MIFGQRFRQLLRSQKAGTPESDKGWNPRAIDLTRDIEDWSNLAGAERALLLRLSVLLRAGDVGATPDLVPLLTLMADSEQLEEELHLTAFLWEESKHAEIFKRFYEEVAGGDCDVTGDQLPAFRRIVGTELPEVLDRLKSDESPEARAEASVTWNMIIVGLLAETGYRAFCAALERRDVLPGMRYAACCLRRDGADHVTHGMIQLARLFAAHGEPVWTAIERRSAQLQESAAGAITEALGDESLPLFGLAPHRLVGEAVEKLGARLNRIASARGRSVEDVRREFTADLT
jgi:ribonucleoside-diphosphate reductase beta chain